MESIKSFLGNPYYLMTAVLAIAAFGFVSNSCNQFNTRAKTEKGRNYKKSRWKKDLGLIPKRLKNSFKCSRFKTKKEYTCHRRGKNGKCAGRTSE